MTTNSTRTTDELVRAARNGNSFATEELVQRYANVVWAAVRRLGLRDDDAQDAVQNTWLRMIQHLGSLRDPDRLPGWLATTARRESIRILHQSRNETVGLDTDLVDRAQDTSPGPEGRTVDGAMSHLLWEHFAELPAGGRELLMTLVRPDAPRYAEFARATGMPIGSVGPRRMRYLHTLRRRLEAAGLGSHVWK